MIRPMPPRHGLGGPNGYARQPQPHDARTSLPRDGVMRIACVTGLMATIATMASAGDIYQRSRNVALAPVESSRQQGETALMTDSGGRTWLSFIDAEYRQVAGGTWLAWPRALRLFTSANSACLPWDQTTTGDNSNVHGGRDDVVSIGTQDGTWICDYLSLTTAAGVVILAWSDQRAGAPKSVVQVVAGAPAASSAPAASVVDPQPSPR
jgi:hypothetical protein